MLANNIKPSIIKVANKMLEALKGARRKYDKQQKEAEMNEDVIVKERNKICCKRNFPIKIFKGHFGENL